MIDILKARINTAGVYICIQGLYLFALGTELYHGRIPIFRIGGHLRESENGWQCAVREAYEETDSPIKYLNPPKTYLLPDGDHIDEDLVEIHWRHETEQEHIPFLVIGYHRDDQLQLSLMYLAQTDGYPVPSSEIKGLLFLDPEMIYKLCIEPITLDQVLRSGSKAVLIEKFDKSLILEPFTQLRLLAKILSVGKGVLP